MMFHFYHNYSLFINDIWLKINQIGTIYSLAEENIYLQALYFLHQEDQRVAVAPINVKVNSMF
jgi:hypothetical protein